MFCDFLKLFFIFLILLERSWLTFPFALVMHSAELIMQFILYWIVSFLIAESQDDSDNLQLIQQ